MSRHTWLGILFWGINLWAQSTLDWETFETLFNESFQYQMQVYEGLSKKPLAEETLSLALNALGLASPVESLPTNPLPNQLGLRGGLNFQKRSLTIQLQGGLSSEPRQNPVFWKKYQYQMGLSVNLPLHFPKGYSDTQLKERLWVWEQRKALMSWRFEALDLFQAWHRAHQQIIQAQRMLLFLQERASVLKQFSEAQLIPKFKWEEAHLEWQTQRQLLGQAQRDYQNLLSTLKTLFNFDLGDSKPVLDLPQVSPPKVLTLPEELEAKLFEQELDNVREGLSPQLQIQLGFENKDETNSLEIQLGVLVKFGRSTEREEAQFNYLQLKSRSSRLQWEQLLEDLRHQRTQFQIQEKELSDVVELRQAQLNAVLTIQHPTEEVWERRWELEKALVTAEENLQNLKIQFTMLTLKMRILCDAIENL
jgi:hypothetical protein